MRLKGDAVLTRMYHRRGVIGNADVDTIFMADVEPRLRSCVLV